MILIALGANLPSREGPPAATLQAALRELARNDVGVLAVSPFYGSRAWPDPRDPDFVNAVARLATPREPDALLSLLKEIEISFGRLSTQRNAPRPLDLDLLDYDGRIRKRPPVLPHPRLQERGFVLVPLKELAPDWRHPVSGLSVRELLDALPAEASELTRLP